MFPLGTKNKLLVADLVIPKTHLKVYTNGVGKIFIFMCACVEIFERIFHNFFILLLGLLSFIESFIQIHVFQSRNLT